MYILNNGALRYAINTAYFLHRILGELTVLSFIGPMSMFLLASSNSCAKLLRWIRETYHILGP